MVLFIFWGDCRITDSDLIFIKLLFILTSSCNANEGSEIFEIIFIKYYWLEEGSVSQYLRIEISLT